VKVVETVLSLQEVGCFSAVLEYVPSPVAAATTSALGITTTANGAGPFCSGQVLAYHDLLGMMQHHHQDMISDGIFSVSKSMLEFEFKSWAYNMDFDGSMKNNLNLNTNQHPSFDDCGWGYCTEKQVEEIFLKNLEFVYNEAIPKLVALGDDENVSLKVVVRSGHCCGSILRQVLKVEHRGQDMTVVEGLKSLSPLNFSAKSQARELALVFVINDMSNIAQEASPVMKALVNLPRYLSQKEPEKTDARCLAIESIMEIVTSIESDDQVGFIKYVMKMAQGESFFRYLVVDLIRKLMTSLEDPVGSGLEHEMEHSWKLKCLAAIVLTQL